MMNYANGIRCFLTLRNSDKPRCITEMYIEHVNADAMGLQALRGFSEACQPYDGSDKHRQVLRKRQGNYSTKKSDEA